MGGGAVKCRDCIEGDHESCVDNYAAHDGLDVMPQMCSCEDGDCAPGMSWACAEWLHNCGWCICSCHEDPQAREVWKEAHRRYVASIDREAVR